MDDETKTAEVPETPPKAELPTPSFESETSTPSPDLDSLKKIEARVEEMDRRLRGLQSVTDKTQQKVSALSDLDVLTEYQELKAGGMSDQAAIQELRLRRLESRPGSESQAPISGKVDAREVSAEGKRIVENMGFSIDDPDVVAVFRGHYAAPSEFYTALAKLGVTMATKTTPAPAQASPMASGSAGGEKPTSDLVAAYEEALTKTPFAKETKELKAELDKRGWGI